MELVDPVELEALLNFRLGQVGPNHNSDFSFGDLLLICDVGQIPISDGPIPRPTLVASCRPDSGPDPGLLI